MAEQLYFSRDSKLYIEFDDQLWEIPVLDGFSFSQSTNQSEISLSEMQGSDGLSRRGNRVFTDSLAPAEWSFSTYVRPYTNNTTNEHHAVEEALWAVMAGADKHIISTTGGGLVEGAGGTNTTVAADSSISGATPGTYTINSGMSGLTYSGGSAPNPQGWEVDIVMTNATTLGAVTVISGGAGWSANETVTIPSALIGGGGDVVLTAAVVSNTAGASFYRSVNSDKNSTFGPAVMEPSSTTDGSIINFGQSNRAVLATCNLFFVMETSTSNPMVYKLESAAFNEASIDFEVDGIATINWSGFAKQVVDLQSKGFVEVVSSSTKTAAAVFNASTGLKHKGVVLNSADGFRLYLGKDADGNEVAAPASTATAATEAVESFDKGVNATTTFIRNRLTQLLCVTTDTAAFPSGSYNLTLTGGNVTISNNISYLVPEELGAVNVPIEHVTGGRTANGSFTCYLTLDTDSGNNGTSVELFNDMTTTGGGLDKVVNDFDVTFQIGGNVAGTPRLDVKIPKCHIDVPTHSIEDVISVETNFGAYTTDFNVANEVQLAYHGDTANKL